MLETEIAIHNTSDNMHELAAYMHVSLFSSVIKSGSQQFGRNWVKIIFSPNMVRPKTFPSLNHVLQLLGA